MMTFIFYGIILANLIFSITLLVTIRCGKTIVYMLPTIVLAEAIAIFIINLISIHHFLVSDSVKLGIISQQELIINNWLAVALSAVVLIAIGLVIMNIIVRLINTAVQFFHDAMPGKMMSIEAAQRMSLYRIDDFYGALHGAAKLLLRFCIANFLLLIIVIIVPAAIDHFTNGDITINAWRYAVLLCNGFLILLPALFMQLSIFGTALKIGSYDSK